MNMRHAFVSVAAGLGLLAATPAVAEPILLDDSNVGDSYTIDFDGFVDGNVTVDGLGAKLTLTLSSIVGNVYNFAYSLTNTTDSGVTSRVSGFAFDTDPAISSASSTGTYDNAIVGGTYPNQVGSVDVCFQGSNSQSCSGGGSGGVFNGDTGTGTLSLNFGSALSSLTLDDFFVRYQSITGAGDIGSASGRQITSTSSGSDVPEPNMMILFGLAALMIFAGTRRRRSARPMEEPAYA
ncbi:cistern family PEP-CTERM protein [Qipengyuania gaetbuli]|nr:cistern family PEP-CTERM protein [Qipengyuania gaetbuli]